MRTLLAVILSMFVLACSSDKPEEVEERTETIGKEIADNYNQALDRAKDVEAKLQEQKEAIDKALQEAEKAARDP